MNDKVYLVGLMDGTRFSTSNVDIVELKKQMISNRTYAVKLGNKGVVKQQVAFVTEASTVNNNEANIKLSVAGELFEFKADDVDAGIGELVDDININNWISFQDTILFNRNAFQYVEEKLAEV